jgi:hypothetical protein
VSRVSRSTFSLLVLLAAVAPGCGGVLYTANVLGANAAIEEARLADAERLSPYEYYYARACLDKAREEAGDAEYQHAVELADAARTHAIEARDRARNPNAASNTTPAPESSGGQGGAR